MPAVTPLVASAGLAAVPVRSPARRTRPFTLAVASGTAGGAGMATASAAVTRPLASTVIRGTVEALP